MVGLGTHRGGRAQPFRSYPCETTLPFKHRGGVYNGHVCCGGVDTAPGTVSKGVVAPFGMQLSGRAHPLLSTPFHLSVPSVQRGISWVVHTTSEVVVAGVVCVEWSENLLPDVHALVMAARVRGPTVPIGSIPSDC